MPEGKEKKKESVKLSDLVPGGKEVGEKLADEVTVIKVGPKKESVEVRSLRLGDYISLYDDLAKIAESLLTDKKARADLKQVAKAVDEGISPDAIGKIFKFLKPVLNKLPAVLGRCIQKDAKWVEENCDLADTIEIIAVVLQKMDLGRARENFTRAQNLLKSSPST